MYFSEIPAPAYLKDRLLYMAQQKQVPHAHLFWGPAGNAGLKLALAFTTYLTCHHPSAEDACGTCKSCLQLGKFTHPDVKFIFPTLTAAAASASGASGSNVLAAWSAFLQEQPYGHLLDWSNYIGTSKSQPLITKAAITELTQYILLNAWESNYKVTLIWLPEYMHPAAAHALLKILEEPTAAQVVFLFVSHSPENLLGTIRSRLQQMYIPPFTDEEMQQIISQHYQQQLSDTTDVATIIKLAAGNAQKAYQLITNNQNDLMQHFTHWMRSCYAYDFSKVLATVDVFHEYEKATQKHFLVYSVWMLRQIWIVRLQVTQLLKVQQAEKEIIQKLGAILDEGTIQQMNEWIQQAHFCIERNVNAKIVFLNLSLKVAQRFKAIRKQ